MGRSFEFYRDRNELNEEEMQRKRQQEEEHQYYLEQERLMNDDDFSNSLSEYPYTEEELFMDIEEDERNFTDDVDSNDFDSME